MPPSPTIAARDQRILAGYRAGATLLELASAEDADPAVARRILRTGGIGRVPLRPVVLPSARARPPEGLAGRA